MIVRFSFLASARWRPPDLHTGRAGAPGQGAEAEFAGRAGRRSSQKKFTCAVCTLHKCQPWDRPTLITARLPCASQNSFARAMPRDLMSAPTAFLRPRRAARDRSSGRS